MCQDHPDKALEYLDDTCEKLLCVSCALLGNHLGHRCKLISEAAPSGRDQFKRTIADLTTKIAELTTQGVSTQEAIEKYSSLLRSRRVQVDDVFGKLIRDLETRRNSLHQRMNLMGEKESSLLNNQLQSGERLKQSMEVIRGYCNDWAGSVNDSQCLMKLLESKSELAKVNELFVANRESSSKILSAPHLIEVSLPSTTKWQVSEFGSVFDPASEPPQPLKVSTLRQPLEVSTLRQPRLKAIFNCETLKMKICLRNLNGSKCSIDLQPPEVVWRVTNLENNTPANFTIKFCRLITRDELEYSYVIPFFNHRIHCSFNGIELSGSPVEIKLSSVAENLNCYFCSAAAVQAHLIESPTLRGKAYHGICSQHTSHVASHNSCSQWDKIPQKCNLGK